MMKIYLFEWISLSLKLFHIVVGIAWIGASFYFNWLENKLNRVGNKDEIDGHLWAIHGGGFYYLEKYKKYPENLPKENLDLNSKLKIFQIYKNLKYPSLKIDSYFQVYEEIFKNYIEKKIIFVEVGVIALTRISHLVKSNFLSQGSFLSIQIIFKFCFSNKAA